MTNFDQGLSPRIRLVSADVDLARHLPGSFIAVLREIALVVSRSVIKGSIATSIPPFDSLPSQCVSCSVCGCALTPFQVTRAVDIDVHRPLDLLVRCSLPTPSIGLAVSSAAF